MKRALISNPPYNMKWDPPPFAQLHPRFASCYTVPPPQNANYAFVLSGLEKNDRCVFLMPCSILSGTNKAEKEIRKYLVESNYVDAIIMCPGNMFESTGISICILVLDKCKGTATVEMVDLRSRCKTETREQSGQYGGKSHENRIYKKKINVIPDDVMDDVLSAIDKRKDIPNFCKPVSIGKIKEDGYTLLASHYFDLQDLDMPKHRDYSDIVNDINRIIREKNACKLTINETIAKGIGFDFELYKESQKEDFGLNDLLEKIGANRLERQNYFMTSKKKNEIKFENGSKEMLSSILIMILNNWKQHIYYLNQEENRYLAELRDALLPELMSGKIDLKE